MTFSSTVEAMGEDVVEPRRPWGLLAHRDFRLLWLGETVSSLGSTVTTVALPLTAVTVLGANSFVVGLLNAAAWLPWLVIGLPAGAWVDRMRRRPIMLACDAVSLALFASVPVAAWLGVLSIPLLVAVALLGGVASVFFSTAYRAFLPSLVPREHLLEGNSKLQGSEQGARIAGRGLGGLLSQLLGPATALLVDAVSFAVSAVCLLRVSSREAPPSAPVERSTLRAQIADGLRFVVTDPVLRALSSYAAVGNLALTGLSTIQIVFLVTDLHVPPGIAGLVIAGSSVGGVVGALAARRIAARFGTARGIVLCALVGAPFALLYPLTTPGPGVLLMFAGAFGTGVSVVVVNVIVAGFRQAYCPPRLLGRVTACMLVVTYSAIPLGALLAGSLATADGNRTALWIIASVFVLACLWLAAGPVRRTRDLPTGCPPSGPP